jgi:hypothetical protein
MKQKLYYNYNLFLKVTFWILYYFFHLKFWADSENIFKTGFLFVSFCYSLFIFLECNLILVVFKLEFDFWLKAIALLFIIFLGGNLAKFVGMFSINYALHNLDLGTRETYYLDPYFINNSYSQIFHEVLNNIKSRSTFFVQFHILPISFYMILWIKNASNDLINAESENNALKLKLLKSKVNPQIVNKAFDYIKSESSELAQQMVLRLSSFLRYLLYESQKNVNTIEAELDFLVNFLEIAEHALAGQVAIDYKIKKSGNNQHIMKSLALYPLLSEVIEKAKSFVDLNIFLENHLLTLRISFDLRQGNQLSDFDLVLIKEFGNNFVFQFSEENDKKHINLVVDFNKPQYFHNENLQMLNS